MTKKELKIHRVSRRPSKGFPHTTLCGTTRSGGDLLFSDTETGTDVTCSRCLHYMKAGYYSFPVSPPKQDVMEKTCNNCRWFELDKHRVTAGSCRRHAPSPVPTLLHIIAGYLSHIGWAANVTAGIEQPKNPGIQQPFKDEEGSEFYIHETSHSEWTSWPIVEEYDFCGEFRSKAEN